VAQPAAETIPAPRADSGSSIPRAVLVASVAGGGAVLLGALALMAVLAATRPRRDRRRERRPGGQVTIR
jgi:hypothetical protein